VKKSFWVLNQFKVKCPYYIYFKGMHKIMGENTIEYIKKIQNKCIFIKSYHYEKSCPWQLECLATRTQNIQLCYICPREIQRINK